MRQHKIRDDEQAEEMINAIKRAVIETHDSLKAEGKNVNMASIVGTIAVLSGEVAKAIYAKDVE